MKRSWIKYIAGVLLVAFIIAQFFPIDKTNPPFETQNDFLQIMDPPEQIAQMIKNACYDCHSHQTKYPWYTNIAPVSWWVRGHIDDAREHLNFSKWGGYDSEKRAHKLEEGAELVEGTEMPLLSYIIAHPEARISKEERAELVAWFKKY